MIKYPPDSYIRMMRFLNIAISCPNNDISIHAHNELWRVSLTVNHKLRNGYMYTAICNTPTGSGVTEGIFEKESNKCPICEYLEK